MSESDSGPSHVFELQRIRDLVELMQEFDLREVDLREGEQRIRLSRGSEVSTVSYVPAAPQSHPQPAATAPGSQATPPAATEGANITYIRSPMVGTFYSRPNPNTPSYVKVGDHIDPNTTVCIIEAMKVFNEIPAEVSGKVVAILVNDEEPVEFGKPLFKIDTSG